MTLFEVRESTLNDGEGINEVYVGAGKPDIKGCSWLW
jgi:hypothetical protein